MMGLSHKKNDLQAYFEQHQDNEAAAAVEAVVASLPSNQLSRFAIKKDYNLVNALLTKESEVSALKEVISKWRTRALEAESMTTYYCAQLEVMQSRYENEIMDIEEEYTHRINEKDELISELQQELHYFASKTYHKSIDEYDNVSIVDSAYDRNAEQCFEAYKDDTPLYSPKIKAESILDGIQNTVNSVEKGIDAYKKEKSIESHCLFSEFTLVEPTQSESTLAKKLKRSSFCNVFKSLPKILKRQTLPLLADDDQSWNQASSNKTLICTLNQLPVTISNTNIHTNTVPI
ncbi:hypothetical protein G6F48_010529 [Rhizopus delemar]|nr:hypothetical protein G6F48_010529 [Rhizopus delemar]